MSEHTPGPWIISRGAQADAFSIEGERSTIAHIKHVREDGDMQTDANARLIAAAPSLLKSLKDLEDVIVTMAETGRIVIEDEAPVLWSVIEDAREVIGTAEGRKP